MRRLLPEYLGDRDFIEGKIREMNLTTERGELIVDESTQYNFTPTERFDLHELSDENEVLYVFTDFNGREWIAVREVPGPDEIPLYYLKLMVISGEVDRVLSVGNYIRFNVVNAEAEIRRALEQRVVDAQYRLAKRHLAAYNPKRAS